MYRSLLTKKTRVGNLPVQILAAISSSPGRSDPIPMDTIKSFKGYGKVDEVVEQQAFRQKTRKRIILIIVSAILLLAIVIAIVVGTLVHNNNKNRNYSSSSSSSIRSVCSVTQYQEACISSLQSLDTNSTSTTDPKQLFKLSLLAVLHELTHFSTFPSNIKSKINDDDPVKAALDVCQVVIDDAIDRINDSISAMEDSSLSNGKVEDLKTWLSTTLTDQETCFDSLEEVNATTVLDQMKELAMNSTHFSSNSLAIVSKILGILSNFNIPSSITHHRRRRSLLQLPDQEVYYNNIDDQRSFPRWAERKLLQETKPTPNVVVAKDRTGDYTTIGEAVAKIPKKNATRFVIYIKAGEYVENVIMDKSMWNVMMYGDGMTNTIVSGSLNKIDGTPTFNTATFAVVGKGFIARDMGFKNTAGPEKEQAVALRSGSDQSVFYRCSFDGYQDTLYAHSNRQFYRECDITGTVDFIFGNSAVVIQSCNIQPRQPGPNQVVTITAQGKKDVNQNTGISIQKCSINPSTVMKNNLTARTYLGRPWKEYSTTIIMQSEIGSFLDPAGWSPWVPGVVPPSTIFYAEYLNTGPGATLDKRVAWDGYRRNTTAAQASKFTVESFIDGNMWLPQTQVLFDLSL